MKGWGRGEKGAAVFTGLAALLSYGLNGGPPYADAPTAGDTPAAGPTRPKYVKEAQFIRKEGGRSRKVGGYLGAKLGLVVCFWSAICSGFGWAYSPGRIGSGLHLSSHCSAVCGSFRVRRLKEG